MDCISHVFNALNDILIGTRYQRTNQASSMSLDLRKKMFNKKQFLKIDAFHDSNSIEIEEISNYHYIENEIVTCTNMLEIALFYFNTILLQVAIHFGDNQRKNIFKKYIKL